MAIISKERTFTLEKLKRIKPLDIAYIFLVLTLILPFFLFKRAAPNYAFFAELTSAICASLFIFFASLSIKKFVIYNRLSIYLIVFAIYLVFDLIINPPIYPSLHWLYIGSLLLCSLLASTLTNFTRQQGIEEVFGVVCYGLMTGGLLQDAVIFLQMLHKDWLYGWIFYINEGGTYSGNIGQRNMTAHYLSWGVLATTYLIYVKKLIKPLGWSLFIVQALFLGATNSRTLLVYMLAIILLLLIAHIWQKQLSKSLLKIIGIIALLVLAFQAITLPTITTLQGWSSTGTTSINRLSSSEGMTIRLVEWYKAWLIFLEHPWFGSGWGSYNYESFVISLDARFIDTPYSSAIFSNTHNIILNLLAELGVLGTFIILGGFTWTLLPLFKAQWQPITIVAISMVVVSTVHSMLEFPLWYLNFFIVFIIITTFVCLSLQAEVSHKTSNPKKAYTLKYFFILASTGIFFLSANLYYNYQRLDNINNRLIQDTTDKDRLLTAEKLLDVQEKQPLLTTYSDIRAIHYLDAIPSHLIPRSFDVPLERFAYYSPDAMSALYYLISQCEADGKWQAKNWLYFLQLNNYYRTVLPYLSVLMSTSNSCKAVYPFIYQQCIQYYVDIDQKSYCNFNETNKSHKYGNT